MDKTKAVALSLEAFSDSVTPKKVKDSSEDLYLFKCLALGPTLAHSSDGLSRDFLPPSEQPCGNVHFRHAGYLEGLMPYMRPDGAKKVDKSSYQVMVCTKCRSCYIWLNEQMYDVSELIDLEAWAKAERELHAATGPGGQC